MRITTRALMGAALTLMAATPAGAAAAGRSNVPGSVPSWAQSSRDRGDVAGDTPVTISVYLPLRDAASAESMVQAVSDPASASYGRYLSPSDFASRFAASDADVAAVVKFLRNAGLSVSTDPSDANQVTATGTVAQAEAAFATTVHHYAFRGRLVDAPARTLSVPSSLDGKVLAVAGLTEAPMTPHSDTSAPPPEAPNSPAKQPPHHSGAAGDAPPPPAFVNAPPCSTYFGQRTASAYPTVNGKHVPYAPCGYTPPQFQGAYDTAGAIGRGVDGRGVTVAITDAYAAPTILQDANAYASAHGQQPFGSGQFAQLFPKKPYRYGYDDQANGDLCGEQGWYGEETLDVEAVHAMAPGANVLFVAGRSCDDPDLLAALRTIISKRRADIITNSWGSIGEDTTPSLLRAYHMTFVQAALEGIGVFFSSGDDGDDSTDTADGSPAVDFPSTEPLVTAVGGTSLGVARDNGYAFETGWSTGTAGLSADGSAWSPAYPGDWLYAGGGGMSSLFGQPFYQRNVVPAAIANGHRATPDIAMDGDPQTGMLVGETQTFLDGSVRYGEYRLGGTSLSSPLYAGMEALADQAAGHAHGFVNPALYRLAGSRALHDVSGPAPVPAVVRVNYNNGENASDGTTPLLRSLDDEAQSLHVARGWDNLTGIGTPKGSAFLGALP
jgi:subtilase family serine protease